MKIAPQRMVARVKEALSRNGAGNGASNGSGVLNAALSKTVALPLKVKGGPAVLGAVKTAMSIFGKVAGVGFKGLRKTKGAARRGAEGETLAPGRCTASFPELQEKCTANTCGATRRSREIGVPEYHSKLDYSLKDGKRHNLIYPVANNVFIHVHPDATDARDFYIAIEPSLLPSLPELVERVDRRLINFVEQLKQAGDSEQRSRILLESMEQICYAGEKSKQSAADIQVTDEELAGLRYLMVRDKEGLWNIEPFISDPYIEDISCSGVGPLFVEYRLFGGLKATVAFHTSEDLDRFVIKLSEKINRPVTVREPIVDATLPDGSRVNIVFGGDVSRRGSNFTIRKIHGGPHEYSEPCHGGQHVLRDGGLPLPHGRRRNERLRVRRDGLGQDHFAQRHYYLHQPQRQDSQHRRYP